MNCKKITYNSNGYPALLAQIPDPPKTLYYLGTPPEELLKGQTVVAIVGSRKISSYGRAVTEKLSGALASKGVIIASGLALGVDGQAHEAALAAGGKAIAVLAGGLDNITPAAHTNLAKRILETGGTIISEYPEGTEPLRPYFVARNRIISGLSHATLITEAAEKSGSLHTAQFALEQGRDVLAVPGNITSPTSVGTNNLIKVGATPITSVRDVFTAVGIEGRGEQVPLASNQAEAVIIGLLNTGVGDMDMLLKESGLDQTGFNQTLTTLEISGKIRPGGNGTWILS